MPVTDRSPLKSDFAPLVMPLVLLTALWTFVPTLVHTAPPLDVVESAMWGREWTIGTYKHPGMPAWVLEASRILSGGRVSAITYGAAQVFTGLTIFLTFLLGRDLFGARVGLAAALALFGVEYMAWRSPEFNHTQAQMLFWVATTWLVWRAAERDQLGWWLALGAVAGVGLYAKLSQVLLLVVLAAWLVSTARGRSALRSAEPWLGAVLFCAIVAPLGYWLFDAKFAPLTYADARAREQSLSAMLLFPANVALQAAPIGIALALAGFFGGHAVRGASEPDARRFLRIVALGPLALSIGMALLSRSGLRATWIAPALPLLALLLVVEWPGRLDDFVLKRLRIVALVIATAVPIGYGLFVTNQRLFGGALMRQNWPEAEIARVTAAAWARATPKPLRIVTGRAWPAGLVALSHHDKTSIFTEGELAFSPWITPERLAREGTLVVWLDASNSGLTPAMQALIGNRPVQQAIVPAPRGKAGSEIILKYVIISPR